MFAALISVAANVGNVLLDKAILSRQKMKVSDYIPLLFLFLFIITAVTLPWLSDINWVLATNQQYAFYFVLMVLLAVIWNIFYYQGIQQEKMIEFEMILLLTPLATIILATIFFPEEFNVAVFAAAIVGSLTLFLSHLRKHHLAFDKYAIHLVLAVFLMAMEAMVQKELLMVYSPALLYALRTGFLALFFTIYYRPNTDEIDNKAFKMVFATALIGAISVISRFYGYQSIGVTFTTLILLLVPILTSWIDAKVNKTPVKHRTVVAFVVILLCVIYAIMNQQ